MTTLNAPITLSASVLIVDAHFPVVKFATLVEEELYKAKTFAPDENLLDASGKPMKNKISFLGNIFTWKQLSEVNEVKDKFCEMIIVHGENKAFLQRIINSFENNDTYYWHSQNPKKPFDPALLWRFLYDYRDIRHKEYFKNHFYQYFFGDKQQQHIEGIYKKYLIESFIEGKEESQVFPVAARWAEFITRKNI